MTARGQAIERTDHRAHIRRRLSGAPDPRRPRSRAARLRRHDLRSDRLHRRHEPLARAKRRSEPAGARRRASFVSCRLENRMRRPQPHPSGARRPDRGGGTGRDRAEQAGARGDHRARGSNVRLPVRLRKRRRTSPRRAGRVRVCVPRQLQRESGGRRRLRHLAPPVAAGCDLEDFAALVDGRARLRGHRALAGAWRPVRRGIGRLRRPGRSRGRRSS